MIPELSPSEYYISLGPHSTSMWQKIFYSGKNLQAIGMHHSLEEKRKYEHKN